MVGDTPQPHMVHKVGQVVEVSWVVPSKEARAEQDE